MKHWKDAGVLGLALTVTLAAPVYAYLDPGTGSYICQLSLAGVLGAVFVLKIYWSKVRAFFAGLLKDRKD